MKRGAPTFRFLFLGTLILATLGVLAARLWWVQVARGSDYTAKLQSKSEVTVRLPAVRGEIFDRNGVLLATNRKSFELDFYLPDILRAYRNEFGKPPLLDPKPKLIIRGMRTEIDEPDMAHVINEVIIPQLQALGMAEDYNSERIQVHYRTRTLIPYPYRQELDFDTIARLLEHNIKLSGIKAEQKPVRFYPYGALAAHVLGYVGPEEDPDPEEEKKYSFYQPDVQGKSNVELFMDKALRGKAGVKRLQRDAKGQILENDYRLVEPKSGDNVYLTLDARIQYLAEQALRAIGRGAAVVVDPNNGDVVALASVPSFDPNTFVPSIAAKAWTALNADDTKPLLNRAISAYPPGSTYKIPVSLAGLKAGVGKRTFPCGGGVSYGDTFMQCWKSSGHGTLGLSEAIKVSCNGFFYRYANAAGIDSIDFVGGLLGLGQPSGIPLSGESPGILPGKEWLAMNHPDDRWREGYTANTAIGQGWVLTSPLQMAMVAATVANGGTAYYPRLIDKVVSPDGKVVSEEPAKIRADLVKDAGLTAEQIEIVRRGMWKVVNEGGGTAGRARIKNCEVAGKTGTAQFKFRGREDNRVWFLAFAPYDKPRYAVCVMVEGGEAGGKVAAPIAGKILEDAFALDSAPDSVQLAALVPAVGHANHIFEVDFGREIPAALGSQSQPEEEETAGAVRAPSLEGQERKVASAPNIRSEPDARGRVTARPPKKERSGLLRFFDFLGGKRKAEKKDSGDTRRKPPTRPGNR